MLVLHRRTAASGDEAVAGMLQEIGPPVLLGGSHRPQLPWGGGGESPAGTRAGCGACGVGAAATEGTTSNSHQHRRDLGNDVHVEAETTQALGQLRHSRALASAWACVQSGFNASATHEPHAVTGILDHNA